MKIEYRISREIWDENLRNLKVENPAFSVIQSKYITRIVSDLGMLRVKEFLEEINRIKNKKLICFDMDNTLVYSDKAHVEAFNKALDELGFRKLAFMEIARHFGKPKEETIKAISGSGVIIDSRGVILTNAHLAEYFLLKDYKILYPYVYKICLF